MPPEIKPPTTAEIEEALKNFPASTEINQALKEFEVKSQAGYVEPVPEASKNLDLPFMVRLVMKLSGGAIKEQRTAEYVLLGVVVLNIIITILVIKFLL
ncbi:hypothetical protein A3A03_00470 [Candidatus Nomurabacteria bacterium RIFCSPLOWO2_01_FULL_40_18]|uniref:Uncharacterized protein n=1 Tax=Candidatus Nomurabacteria bacterium RIFCSPLOWO2_01_FULL_40_18 TaxID=1801773 RepID=A0A1F6XHN9_9BACT|nr:MAG: hypothetical protein A3A03_00470 [Candidatus Nomurabacteria bacterium RIFCSPLOWO2_01_FULL_40_18]